ncbi:MAG TPA: FtsX-like permease family protein [Blastocatellia bacterium]|nr:FtsX-like permease family protein [Blastocatellia bacterium]
MRVALGAQRRDILKLAAGQGLSLLVTGVVIGLAAAFVLTRVMSSLLFGVSATDPMTLYLNLSGAHRRGHGGQLHPRAPRH